MRSNGVQEVLTFDSRLMSFEDDDNAFVSALRSARVQHKSNERIVNSRSDEDFCEWNNSQVKTDCVNKRVYVRRSSSTTTIEITFTGVDYD